jgi:hypothetical protein
MKPNDIMFKTECIINTGNKCMMVSVRAYSNVKKTLEIYLHQDCVVAYDTTSMGVVFLIKGKTKYFAFFQNKFKTCGGQKHIGRIPLNEIYHLLKNKTIVDQDLWKVFEKKLFIGGL